MDLPLSKEALKPLRTGDILYLSGPLYTARDAAHKRIAVAVSSGQKPPIDLTDAAIFYTGPCPAKPGAPSGPLSPTTSARMDSFVELMFKLGMSSMIGKGDRAPYVTDLCRHYGGVYLLGFGGAAALTASWVIASELVAYEDLGTEAIRRLTVEKMKVIVGIDSLGTVLMEQEIPKYRYNG
ncbi:MAG: FumA C-terminus/TtdB family hydratase beta subunit [Symbiobacteriaceae bacterium]|nr:FumA C-terminus/TtdB family hydratase beta subunit [Symbiobacteriaceae bacterium]